MDIAAGIALGTQSLKLVKEILTSGTDLAASELKMKLTDVTIALSEMKLALSDAQQIVREKDAEISRLKSMLKKRAELVEKDGFKFQRDDNGNGSGYAFCPKCESGDGKLIRLIDDPVIPGLTACPTCDGSYRARQSIWGHKTPHSQPSRANTDWDVFDI